MPVSRRFSRAVAEMIDESKIFRIRAGADSGHRFLGIWAVVVDGRVFARSWTLKPGGWYHTILEERAGTVQVGDREIPVRAARVRGERILQAIDEAYAAKYSTPASKKYVRGLRTPRRRETTMEFMPR
jgi:hypothetical protein